MTFPARLTELLEKATKGPFVITPGWISGKNHHPIANFNFGGSKERDKELIAYLVNHAEAIRDLVVAAENYLKHGTEPDCEALAQALAKLEEA